MYHTTEPPQPTQYRGATHTFSPRLEPPILSYSCTNGASAAASFVGTGEQMPAKVSYGKGQMWKDGGLPNIIEKSPIIQAHNKNLSESYTKNGMPNKVTLDRGQSPSQIAALAAVKKFSPSHHGAIISRPVSSRPLTREHSESNPSLTIWSADETPIPATNELVKLFESQIEGQNSKHFKPLTTAIATSPISKNSEKLVHTKLAKASLTNHLPHLSANNEQTAILAAPQGARLARLKSKIIEDSVSSPPQIRSFNNLALVREKASHLSDFTTKLESDSSESSYSSALDRVQSPGFDIFPSSINNTKASKAMHFLAPTNQSVAAKNSRFTPSIAAEHYGNDKFARAGTRLNSEGILLPHSLTPKLTASSLANAMVASSLASSRAPSPSRPIRPPIRHQSKSHLLFHQGHSQELLKTRTPSPVKAAMRQTMREALKSDEESERWKKNRYISKKHPNKHHEGDRKRWRDQITEQERKRYEGVWAANKGLLMPSQDTNSDITVVNLVVRDIWHRSRLPNDVLQEIWDLVDNEAVGRLAKDEFVVGMWLIDQRLKGRKLPLKVSESIWSSARRLSGIKAPKRR